MTATENATAGGPSMWTRIILPANVFNTACADIKTMKDAGFNFQKPEVKEAGLRSLYLVGMAFAGLVIAKTLWDLAWTALSVAITLGVSGTVYLVSRDRFEKSRGEKGAIAELSEQSSNFMQTGKNVQEALTLASQMNVKPAEGNS